MVFNRGIRLLMSLSDSYKGFHDMGLLGGLGSGGLYA